MLLGNVNQSLNIYSRKPWAAMLLTGRNQSSCYGFRQSDRFTWRVITAIINFKKILIVMKET